MPQPDDRRVSLILATRAVLEAEQKAEEARQEAQQALKHWALVMGFDAHGLFSSPYSAAGHFAKQIETLGPSEMAERMEEFAALLRDSLEGTQLGRARPPGLARE